MNFLPFLGDAVLFVFNSLVEVFRGLFSLFGLHAKIDIDSRSKIVLVDFYNLGGFTRFLFNNIATIALNVILLVLVIYILMLILYIFSDFI